MATINEILKALRSDDEKTRQNAVVVMIKSLNPKAIQYLEMIAANDPSDQIRLYAKKGIEYIKNNLKSKSIENPNNNFENNSDIEKKNSNINPIKEIPENFIYLKKYLNSKFKEEILYGIQSIRENNINGFLPELLKCLTLNKDVEVISSLISVIAIFGNSSYIKLIIPYLDNFESDIRAAAISALEKIGDKDCSKYIIHLLKDSDPKCRNNAKKVLIKFGEKNAIKILKEMINNDIKLNLNIAYGLSFFNSNEAVSILVSLIEKDPENLKNEVISSLKTLSTKFSNQDAKFHFDKLTALEKDNSDDIDILDKLMNIEPTSNNNENYSNNSDEIDLFGKLSDL